MRFRREDTGSSTSRAPVSRRSVLAGLTSTVAFSGFHGIAKGQDATFDWSEIELLDDADRRFHVEDSAQPWVLIKLWANWCAACMRELDSVANIAAEIGSNTIEVILVSHPDDWARNQEITRGRNLSVRCARPSPANSPAVVQAGLMSGDGNFYVPRSMLFSRRQRMTVWSHFGSVDWSRPDAVYPLRRWIG